MYSCTFFACKASVEPITNPVIVGTGNPGSLPQFHDCLGRYYLVCRIYHGTGKSTAEVGNPVFERDSIEIIDGTPEHEVLVSWMGFIETTTPPSLF